MMRILFFLTMMVSLPAWGQGQVLKRKIEKRYNSNGQLATQVISDFDRSGFMIKRSVLDAIGQMLGYHTYTNDSIGMVLIDSGYNKKLELDEIWIFEYDKNNNIIKQTREYPLRGDTYIEFYEITYDSENNVVEEKQYDKEMELDWVYNYEYNNENRRTRYTSRFKGTIRNEITYAYKKGLKIEEFLYDYENKELRKRENTLYFFKYNKSGLLLKKTARSVAEHLPREIINEYKYYYNKKGDLISEVRYEDGKVDRKETYEYTYW